MSYCDGKSWSDICAKARGIHEVMRGMAELVFFPPVPGLHHWLVTPGLLQLILGWRLLAISVFTHSAEVEVRLGFFYSLRFNVYEVSKRDGRKGNRKMATNLRGKNKQQTF